MKAWEEIASLLGGVKALSERASGAGTAAITDRQTDRHMHTRVHTPKQPGLLAGDARHAPASASVSLLGSWPHSLAVATCASPAPGQVPVLGLRTTVLSLSVPLTGCWVPEAGSLQDLHLGFPSACDREGVSVCLAISRAGAKLPRGSGVA